MCSLATHANTHTHTLILKSRLSLTKEPVALPQPDALYGLKTALLHNVYLSAIFTCYCVDVCVSACVCVPHQGMFEPLTCAFKCSLSCAHVSMVVCKWFFFLFMVTHCFLHWVEEADKSFCLLSDSAQQAVNGTVSFYTDFLYQLFVCLEEREKITSSKEMD